MVYEYETKNLIAKLSGVWVESEKKEILKELQEVYRKAKAFDEIVEYKHNIMEVKEISLTHATEEPFNSDMYSVHSLVDNLLDVINEYEECADDER